MRFKKWSIAGLAVVAAGALAFGTLGIAQAQTPPGGGSNSGPSRGRGLEALAQQLGVTVDQLRNATQQVRNQLIDQAVAAGRITKEQGDRLKSGPGGPNRSSQGQSGNRNRGGMMGGFGSFGLTDIYGTLAGSLGITEDQLRTELRTKSLAEVGAERGRTPEMLKNTLITQIKADLQAQVASGKMNQRTVDRIVAGLDRVLPRLITAKRGDFQPGQFGPRSGQQGAPQGAPQRAR